MILTVDVGNTQIKFGAWDNDKLFFVSRLETNTRKTRDEYAVDLMSVFGLYKCNHTQFDGAIIACVVPALNSVIRDAVEKVIRSDRVYVISPGLKTGLNILIDNPATLGADMVCAAVAAIAKYTLPCIIVSMGTATAIFAINAEGGFLGGSVCAGVGISLEALSVRTAQLPHISLDDAPTSAIGSNTVDSIRSGVIYGTADMIDGMVRRMQELVGVGVAVACGGIAEFIVPHCSTPIILDHNLVLEGLRLIYLKNTKS